MKAADYSDEIRVTLPSRSSTVTCRVCGIPAASVSQDMKKATSHFPTTTSGPGTSVKSNKDTECRIPAELPNCIQLSIYSRCLTPKCRTVTCCTITAGGTMGYLLLTKVWACVTASSLVMIGHVVINASTSVGERVPWGVARPRSCPHSRIPHLDLLAHESQVESQPSIL